MKEMVRIKSFAKGLVLQMDDKIPFDELLSIVAEKFAESKNFFGKETVAISFHGRKLSDEEEIQLLECIEYNCYLKIRCIVEKDPAKERLFVKAMDLAEVRKLISTEMEQEVEVVRRSLTNGEELVTQSSVVIFGDVEAGCTVTSERNICVLGGLYGKAHAGFESYLRTAIVAAVEMAPEELTIGRFRLEASEKKPKWGKKKEDEPKVARIYDGAIVLEPFSKEHFKKFS